MAFFLFYLVWFVYLFFNIFFCPPVFLVFARSLSSSIRNVTAKHQNATNAKKNLVPAFDSSAYLLVCAPLFFVCSWFYSSIFLPCLQLNIVFFVCEPCTLAPATNVRPCGSFYLFCSIFCCILAEFFCRLAYADTSYGFRLAQKIKWSVYFCFFVCWIVAKSRKSTAKCAVRPVYDVSARVYFVGRDIKMLDRRYTE